MSRLQGDPEEATNPAAPECSISGCGCGPALMVASGLASIGLGSDHVSGIRVQLPCTVSMILIFSYAICLLTEQKVDSQPDEAVLASVNSL